MDELSCPNHWNSFLGVLQFNVNTDDLNGGEKGGGGLHYNRAGYATLGQRFAEKAIALVKNK